MNSRANIEPAAGTTDRPSGIRIKPAAGKTDRRIGMRIEPAAGETDRRIGMRIEPAAGETDRRIGMRIEQVLVGPPYEGEAGVGLALLTNRGEVRAIQHAADDARGAVIWVCGARGGFGGPANGLYAQLAEELVRKGITSLRMDYRYPNQIQECALDLLAGVGYLKTLGYGPVVVVGHSFGGAVVIAGASLSNHIAGVVSLSPQTYGAQGAGLIAPTPLLVAHGKADTRLPFSCAVAIYDWAKEPKELKLYEGAEHRLDECREELADLLREWIPTRLLAGAG